MVGLGGGGARNATRDIVDYRIAQPGKEGSPRQLHEILRIHLQMVGRNPRLFYETAPVEVKLYREREQEALRSNLHDFPVICVRFIWRR